MKPIVIAVVCLLIAAPAFAQQSEARRNTEKKATFMFWTGISVAAAGIPAATVGAPGVAVPFFAGGGALIYYGVHLNNKAKQMPFTTFSVGPINKGVAFGVRRSW